MRRLTTTGSNAVNWDVTTPEEEIAADDRAYIRSLRERECYANQERLEMEASKRERIRLDAIEQLFGKRHRSADQIREDKEYERFINTPIKQQVVPYKNRIASCCCHSQSSTATATCFICSSNEEFRSLSRTSSESSKKRCKHEKMKHYEEPKDEMRFWCPLVRIVKDNTPYNEEISANFYAQYLKKAENFKRKKSNIQSNNDTVLVNINDTKNALKAYSEEPTLTHSKECTVSTVECTGSKDIREQAKEIKNCFSSPSKAIHHTMKHPENILIPSSECLPDTDDVKNLKSILCNSCDPIIVLSVPSNVAQSEASNTPKKLAIKSKKHHLRPRHLRAKNRAFNDDEFVVDMRGMSFEESKPLRCYQCLMNQNEECSHTHPKGARKGTRSNPHQSTMSRKNGTIFGN